MNTITNLAICNNKKNKTRSILIMISIFLSTLLLTAIASYAYGIIKSNHVNASKMYGSYYGSYRNVGKEQLDKMKLRGEFTDIGKLAFVGEVQNNKNLSLAYCDDTTLKLNNLEQNLIEGGYPEKENEIAAKTEFFKALGYENPKLGDTITLNYRLRLEDKYKEETFVISGFEKESNTNSNINSFIAYVAEDFYNGLIPEEEQLNTIYFRLNDAVSITIDNSESVLKEIAKECGIEEKNVSPNNYYLIWALDPGMETIAICTIIALLVIVFTVIVIYNIFQLGITRKIQEYGKLKALGSTKKQMKKIVFREGMSLAIIGIPLGLIGGVLLASISFDWLMNQSNRIHSDIQMERVSFISVPILLLAAMIAFFTVWIALKRPMKIVSSISPVEAMRYQESNKHKKNMRKRTIHMNVLGMTKANLLANKKSTITTICTMGLSCVLFVTIASLTGNMDEEYDARKSVEYGQFLIRLDYSLHDVAYPENNLDQILKNNPFGGNTVEEIKAMDGVKEVVTRNILVMKQKNTDKKEELMAIAVLNKTDFKKKETAGGIIGNVDYKEVSQQNGIIHGWSHFTEQEGYSLGETISMNLENGVEKVTLDAPLLGAFGNLDQGWAITEDTYNKLGLKASSIGYIWVDCNKKEIEKVASQLNEYFSDIEHITIETYQDALKLSKLGIGMMKVFCYTFLAILGLIGFMNMANTMITSIIIRKQEFGVLQAIGMTKKQLNRSLQIEGLVLTIGTVLIALAVGIPMGYSIFSYGKSQSLVGLNRYKFPMMEIVIMITIITVLQLVLSFVLSRNVKKESLIERIRYQG